ncbi:hypothetical protein SAMN05446589_5526 [Streptomyces sp. OV198]|jgi:hypothetical protein|uniref:hypothetical protein n=1 Tax=Streptomyces sp. OV198 TaxID=1882787 RepID=UPI000BD15415|nr:hypothetical protein [Streptomyces sp. OV198]SOE74918.1 hypothetical protein SAMN05446589_5526 [Streptomyces sp. OV198]
MPPRQQPHITDASAAPYRSTACGIGTHHACAESSPAVAPVDLPVVYEVCDCPCHSASSRSTPAEVRR